LIKPVELCASGGIDINPKRAHLQNGKISTCSKRVDCVATATGHSATRCDLSAEICNDDLAAAAVAAKVNGASSVATVASVCCAVCCSTVCIR
jgi:hypothetical protein